MMYLSSRDYHAGDIKWNLVLRFVICRQIARIVKPLFTGLWLTTAEELNNFGEYLFDFFRGGGGGGRSSYTVQLYLVYDSNNQCISLIVSWLKQCVIWIFRSHFSQFKNVTKMLSV